jgi:hypothetical protein
LSKCENCGKELEESEVYEGLNGETLCYECYLEQEDSEDDELDFPIIFGED